MSPSFQCNIDLQKGVLHIGTTGTQTPFLAENELPEIFRLTSSPEDEAKAMADNAKLIEDEDIKRALEESKAAAGSRASTSGATAAAAAAVSAAAALASTTILPTDKFTEELVKEIAALGFTREQIIPELRTADGVKTTAVAALFAKAVGLSHQMQH